MQRRWTGLVSILAVLFASFLTPYRHVHHADVTAEHDDHRADSTGMHGHFSPHADLPDDHDADRDAHADSLIWSVPAAFQSASPPDAPEPMLVVERIDAGSTPPAGPVARLTDPVAHGPPCLNDRLLRAPPSVPPVIA